MKLKSIYSRIALKFLSKPRKATLKAITRGNKYLGIGKSKRIRGVK